MTSPATDRETRDYLQRQNHFGLAAEDVKVFCQGTMPAVDSQTGKLLLAAADSLFLSPDGHGGMLAALDRSGGLAHAKRRGIKQLFYCQIDNPLVAIADPEFVGFHLLARSELSTQVVAKQTSRDKVGNVALIDGRLQIIEYSDLNPLPNEVVERSGPDGKWIFWAGSIGVHVFDAAFLERMASHSTGLPFHRANKAVPYIDSAGNRVEPEKPNAIKFERFVFDLLPWAERGIVIEADEATNFAPVKNAPGEAKDTPEIVQRAMISLHRDWLERAGAKIAANVPVEISPLFAQDEREVDERLPKGTVVSEPRYFR
jgi:UDP-N-acetylglucosamine/UDP-N-acetylgalactosamine diphosphorylase